MSAGTADGPQPSADTVSLDAGRSRRRWRLQRSPLPRDNQSAARAAYADAAAMMATRVELIHVENRVQNWVRFGRPARDEIIDRRRRALWFAAGAVFAYARWRSNDHGTVLSRIDILRASVPGETIITVPGVAPGGVALLRIAGWPQVARVLVAIDQVEAIDIDPIEVCPDHWQHVHNRISAGAEPRPYTAERHRAWLFRRDDFLC